MTPRQRILIDAKLDQYQAAIRNFIESADEDEFNEFMLLAINSDASEFLASLEGLPGVAKFVVYCLIVAAVGWVRSNNEESE